MVKEDSKKSGDFIQGYKTAKRGVGGLIRGVEKAPNTIINTTSQIVGRILTFAFKLIIVIAIIGIIVIGGIFIARCNASGGCNYYKEQGVYLIKTGGGKLTQIPVISGVLNFVFTGATSPLISGDFGETKPEIKRLIEIGEISKRPLYEESEPIDIRTTLTAYNLDRDIEVKLSCDLKGYEGPKKYSSSGSESSDKFVLKSKDGEQYTGIGCVFENGVKVSGTQVLDTIPAKLEVASQSSAESVWRPTMLYSRTLEKKKVETVRIINTEPSYDSSVKLLFAVFDPLPFREDVWYPFQVTFKELDSTLGNLETINSLNLYAPASVELDTSGLCDFRDSGERDEEGSKIYEAKPEFLKRVNVDCDDLLSKTGLSEGDCILGYKTSIFANCRMRFTVDKNLENPTYVAFKADSQYTYKLKKDFLISIRRGAVV